jgi:hypothetical protein
MHEAIRAARAYEAASCATGAAARIVLSIRQSRGGTVDDDVQAKALRLQMCVLCSECAQLIDLAEGDRPQRDVESMNFVRHISRGARVLVGNGWVI